MPTGTVMEFNKFARRGRIRPDGWKEDLLTDSLKFARGRALSLEVGQRVCFGISEGPQGIRASHVVVIPAVDFQVEEKRIDGPDPIERTLLINSEPIAVVYLDETGREATLAWPLTSNVRLQDVIDSYLQRVLPATGDPFAKKRLEFWIDDQFYEAPLGAKTNSQVVLNIIETKRRENGGFLGLLQISSGDELMELLFDQPVRSPVRLVLVMSAIPYEPLIEIFSGFHKNDLVRDNPGIAACAFGSQLHGYCRTPEYILDPLPILWEVTDELEDLLDR